MANTTASIVGNYGNGDLTGAVFHSVGRPLPTIDHVCGMYEVPVGVAAVQLTKQGAALTNATAAEGDTAATAQAFNALTTQTLTPGYYVGAVSPTTEAMNRANPSLVDLVAFHEDEIVYPHRRTVAYDASIGIVKVRFGGLSNRVGTSGSPMVPTTLTSAYLQLCTQVKAEVDAFAWLTLKQWTELVEYGLTTASSAWGGPAAKELFQDLLAFNEVPVAGYRASWGPIHIFVDPDPAGQGVDGSGNDLGAMFIPALAGLNGFRVPDGVAGRFDRLNRETPGGLPLAPAFAIGYRADPAMAPRKIAMPSGMGARMVTKSGIPIEVLPRMYTGQNLGQIDAWSAVATVELNDNSGVGLRSVT